MLDQRASAFISKALNISYELDLRPLLLDQRAVLDSLVPGTLVDRRRCSLCARYRPAPALTAWDRTAMLAMVCRRLRNARSLGQRQVTGLTIEHFTRFKVRPVSMSQRTSNL